MRWRVTSLIKILGALDNTPGSHDKGAPAPHPPGFSLVEHPPLLFGRLRSRAQAHSWHRVRYASILRRKAAPRARHLLAPTSASPCAGRRVPRHTARSRNHEHGAAVRHKAFPISPITSWHINAGSKGCATPRRACVPSRFSCPAIKNLSAVF